MGHAKRPTVWVLVADGEHARVVTPDAVEGRFVTALRLGVAEHPHYPPVLRYDPHHQDPHRHDREQFGTEVAHRLNDEAGQGSFDELVLVAPGHVLHAVREGLNRPTAARVVGTLPRDLCKLNDHDLSAHLAEWWRATADAAA